MRLVGQDATQLTVFVSYARFLSLVWLLVTSLCPSTAEALTAWQTAALRKETEDLFYHGFENYMKYAFPEDELRPISCKPLTRDRDNPAHVEVNDALGNYSLTLIDSLSTLAILASSPSSAKRNKPLSLFQDGVQSLVEQYGDGIGGESPKGLKAEGFDLDSKVQVFETVIRGLGGLLSAHLFAVGELPIRGYEVAKQQSDFAQRWHKWDYVAPSGGIVWSNGFEYDGQLLRLAYDLGLRLIPAFFTTTGIPYPRVNLRYGIPFYANSVLNSQDGQCDARQGAAEITETCSAGAGSLVLEFSVLSRLTGDPRFEDLAKRAFWSIWSRRSDVGLIGSGIDAEKGHWIETWTGIGAGIDSFFEYAFKSHVLLSRDVHPTYDDVVGQDPRWLSDPLTEEERSSEGFRAAWDLAHASIERHLYRGPNFQHPHYIQADLTTGAARGFWMDSLSAYYPGLLTLAGHVEEAIETHLLTTALWTRFSAIPERWNLITGGVEGGLGWWVGRPEFIESTYYLFRATEDPWYFHVGEMVLRDIKRRCWTKCGWAGLQNVVTGEKIDRMESFFLGETAKYLFLLFDPDHPLNKVDEPFVFSTEGHPLVIPRGVGRTTTRKYQSTQEAEAKGQEPICPVKPPIVPFSVSSTAARGDVYHAAALARLHLMPTRDSVESLLGEYAVDHPSITASDVNSPSNYTYFPWTLPPELVPFNAVSTPMQPKPTFDIAFPTLPNTGQPSPPLQRVKEGILINFIGGLRLALIQDVSVGFGEASRDVYRVQAINNVALGKDEKVFLAKSTGYGVLNPSDPNFTRVRDSGMLDIVIDFDVRPEPPVRNETRLEQTKTVELQGIELETGADSTVKAAWNALLTQIGSMLRDKDHPTPFTPPPVLDNVVTSSADKRFYIAAISPTGIGAAPFPDWVEAPSPSTSDYYATPLLWTRIYATDELCDHKIPLSVARNNQVIIIRRGGCSFSKKLSNIPAFTPSVSTTPTSLQLVIIVSYTAGEGGKDLPEDWLIRPLLDEVQYTSSGLVRQNPIPMVMISGGERSYEALSRAIGVGVKRRYSVQAKGVPISNLIII